MMTINYCYEWNGNPDFVTLHLTEQICPEGFCSKTFLPTNNKTLELYSLLSAENGVVSLTFRNYSITAERGKAFGRDEVLDNLFNTFKIWMEMQYEEIEWIKEKTIRQDIADILCESCRIEQQKEMQETMRDFDTLEY